MKQRSTLAISLLLALALATSGCSGNGSHGQDATGPIEVTFERLSDGVAAAGAVLLDAPGLYVTQTRTMEDHTVGWAWVTSRANGDFVSVNRQELIEADGGEPGGAIVTLATVLVDGSFFTASTGGRDDNQPWSLVNRDVVTGRLAPFTGIGVDLEGSGILPLPQQGPSAGELTRQATVDGGVVWSWTAPFYGGSAVQVWNVHPRRPPPVILAALGGRHRVPRYGRHRVPGAALRCSRAGNSWLRRTHGDTQRLLPPRRSRSDHSSRHRHRPRSRGRRFSVGPSSRPGVNRGRPPAPRTCSRSPQHLVGMLPGLHAVESGRDDAGTVVDAAHTVIEVAYGELEPDES